MYFQLHIEPLPAPVKIYSVERKTVWSTIEPENLLIIVTEGACFFEVENKEYLLEKNQAIFIPAGQEYKRRPKDNLAARFYYIHFTSETAASALTSQEAASFVARRKELLESAILSGRSLYGSPLDALLLSRVTTFNDEINALTSKMRKISFSQHIESVFLCTAYFYEILGFAMSSAVAEAIRSTDVHIDEPLSHKVQKAVLYINQNYKKKIPINELCTVCSVSPQHLIRLFNEHLGTTPTQYINRIKMNHAKNLIQNNRALSMKEIAYELGFENPNYFSRLFLKSEGETPSNFKAKVTLPNRMYQSGLPVLPEKAKKE